MNTKQEAVKLRDIIDLCEIVKMLAKTKKSKVKSIYIFLY